ncbi:MAG: DinB family protein [Gemmatimonadaceae bacterium]
MTASGNTSDAPLSARLSELVDYATDTRQHLEAFVQSVPPTIQAQRSDPDGWSVAEHVEHLCMIEDSIGRLITSMAKQLRADNVHEGDAGSMLGSLDQFGLTATRFKLVAPEAYRPTGTLSTEEAMEKLRSIRVRVLEGVHKANGLDLTKATFPHPFFGPMDGYQWLLLIGQHEMRHLNQMKDTLQMLTATPTASEQTVSQGSL